MALSPDFESFRAGFESGNNQIVWTRLPADLDTPVSAMLKLAGAQRHAFMLESVTGGEVRGRYSIIGMNPDLVWECRGTSSRVNRAARWDDDAWEDLPGHPLDALRALLNESRIALPPDLPPASAGLFGYLGYDMVRLVENLPDNRPDPLGLPDAVLLRPTVVAVLDGVKGDVILVAPAWARSGLSARAAYAQAAERVMDARAALERGMPPVPRSYGEPRPAPPPVSNFTKAGFIAAVERAKEYIRAGDIFQVVPAQRWTQTFREPPFALYRSLRRTNPSPSCSSSISGNSR
ncbi:Anthranilate/para-aminobenzoate synthase component I [Rubellimicrobium thermophilum DSM 16684]|uniref:Anthranilate synthase component 1 n=1 Tax=Rubellimicrobium thermophilum DSM 16684 TaxID=1123069 RepID=S9RX11_9RHOB|nr:Anthranilate/para-aminobenzoate synthase component I [Rubellimicrobium thermophilum DSM 16684]